MILFNRRDPVSKRFNLGKRGTPFFGINNTKGRFPQTETSLIYLTYPEIA
jgi:hypothetical protein